MSNSFDVEVRDQDARDLFDRIVRHANDATPLMREIGISMTQNIRLCFVDSKSPWGVAWADLKYRAGQPLIDTGLLRNSFSYQAAKTGVSIGTNRRFSPTVTAAVHQFGSRDGRIAARPFMPIRNDRVDLPPSWEAEVIGAIRRHADQMLGGVQ